MAGKNSVKTVSAIFLLCTVVIGLCACMVPVDIEAFFNDPQVQVIVEATKEKVKIHEDSDDFANLIAGNGKISGLTPGKYFRVDEYDKEMVFKRSRFIKANGDLVGTLGDIGPLTGNQIGKLTNFYTYKIKSAQPFGEGTYEYFTFGNGNSALEADVSNNVGITTAVIAINETGKYYLDLSNEIDVSKNYEIMMVPSTRAWGTVSRLSAYYKGSLASNLPSVGSSYQQYNVSSGKEIGMYQYPDAVNTGSINLRGKSIIECPEAGTPPSDYVFIEYDKDYNITKFIFLRVEVKLIPTAADFTFDNLTQTYGDVTAVIITPKDGKSSGEITIYYEGANGTTYDKSDTLPTDAGKYDVTFDVAEAVGFTAASGLSAGTLIISEATPTADDYDIDNLSQTVGNITAVSITPKDGKSSGGITIYYEGIDGTIYPKNTALPSGKGKYDVTFDVDAAVNWNGVTGLSAGTLTISEQEAVIIHLDLNWTTDAPDTADFTDSQAQYSVPANTMALTLSVTGITASESTYKWYLDDKVELGTGNNINNNYSLNTPGDQIWWQPGIHTITLIVDNMYSYSYQFPLYFAP
ncbi:hypothetical protein R84B8_01306 [Treponema sp. R8-4-B8]